MDGNFKNLYGLRFNVKVIFFSIFNIFEIEDPNSEN